MRKQKGITLVSLVVTIIVLIILAGVSINAILGENGIITIAKQAKENIELAQEKEKTELNELYMQMSAEDGTTGEIDYDAISKLLEFKRAIAEGITEAGINTNEDDTAEIMVNNIKQLAQNNATEGNTQDLYEAMQYSGLVTEDMTFSEICEVLKDKYPSYMSLISESEADKWTAATGTAATASKSSTETGLVLEGIGTTTGAEYRSIVFTREFIDLTGFNTLNIAGTVSGVGASNGPSAAKIELVSEKGESITLYSSTFTGTVLTINIKKDISELEGNYAFKVTPQTYGNWRNIFTFTTFELEV